MTDRSQASGADLSALIAGLPGMGDGRLLVQATKWSWDASEFRVSGSKEINGRAYSSWV
jgi:hypothetical protein